MSRVKILNHKLLDKTGVVLNHVFFFEAILLMIPNPGFSTIIFITFWDFLMFYQIFLSAEVNQCAIITYKHGIYQLPHELPNDLRLRILGN